MAYSESFCRICLPENASMGRHHFIEPIGMIGTILCCEPISVGGRIICQLQSGFSRGIIL
ncbi:MAG: hypothetical protein CMF59_03345 [Leptospiraceae bacterium]|nr:hypothetical protein [Leptospiraceae bacterium]